MERLTTPIDGNAKSVALKTIGAGETFHFAHLSWTEAVSEKLFYMVCGIEKGGRMTIVNVFDGELLERDSSQRVVRTEISIIVGVDVLT